ncbi:SDR family oxidoreductase [Bdellovibrio bacteriovorus]|uniref:SDR family oxidoreductase n=1 Tax=Bdellovibrio bacteriovorus TaxID=959 RepID=UPI0035A590C1
MDFKGKNVFITGANRGIGAALVRACLNRGVAKVYAAAREKNTLPNNEDPRVVPLQLDITNAEQISEAVSAASDVQILINNAGTLHGGSFLEGNRDGFLRDMQVNCFATMDMMRAFVPVLKHNTDCRIVNIVSIAKFVNFPFIAGYSASKAALYSMTQAARIELSPYGIAVHAVNPGAIDTDMNKGAEMDMTSPSEVADSILAHVEKEVLDIVPDKIGQAMFKVWQESPMGLENLAKEMYFKKPNP